MLPKSGGSPPATMNASDRRVEKRHRGKGSLKLSFDDPAHQEVNGRLVDYSHNGFRAFHDYPALLTGQVVRFRHALDAGQARVMWNRIADECVETGFLVVK